MTLSSPASAVLMKNNDYILRYGNFNSISGSVSSDQHKLGFTSGGDLALGLYSGENFKVRAGFQYVHSIIPFSLTVSSQTINFGTLNPGEPISRTNRLKISNGSAFGFQITAIENHSPKTADGNIIPDTTCDSGSCTQNTAASWTGLLTYGFGYRCDDISGNSCSSDFTNVTYFKQFANKELNEPAASVMSGTNVGRDIEGEITYKINIPGTQPSGLYQNIVQYIATPTL